MGWEGRLDLRLDDDQKGRRVRGDARVRILSEDEGISLAVEVVGERDDDRLVLELVSAKGPSIRLEGDVFQLPDGGAGLRGTYEVTAESFSPLRAGVIAASRGRLGREELAVPTAEKRRKSEQPR
jgi:hypothetical protein